MTLAETLREAEERLRAAGIDDPRLEAEVLLRHALAIPREALFARLRDELATADGAAFAALIDRRLGREPTAYIAGHKEFFGLEFACTPAALIPRPETELLVEYAIEWAGRREGAQHPLRIADVGTGGGANAVALARHVAAARIVAIDVSRGALLLARRNAAAHDVCGAIDIVRGSLLAPLSGRFDMIVANLPYIPTRTYRRLAPEIVKHEPEQALHAGARGTAIIEALLKQAPTRLRSGGLLLAEHAWNQGGVLREAARAVFPHASIETRRDLAGRERLLAVQT